MRARTLVVALQSQQPFTVTPIEAFPSQECDLVVLTEGDAGTVLREDVDSPVPEVITLDRAEWSGRIGALAADRPVEIVTNDEYCLATCAQLRAETGLAARHPDQPAAYLDKVVMKRLLAADRVRIPRFHAFEPVVTAARQVAERVVAEVGLPAVAKPRQEANSRGIQILRTPDEVLYWFTTHDGEPGWQVDEYIEGTLHHVNAVVRDDEITPVQVGRYLGPLLGVDVGRILGGATEPATLASSAAAHALNERVVRALGSAGRFVVHTEFAIDRAGEQVVLEVAARAPGALVSEMARLHAGVNLEVMNLRMQAGLPVPEPDTQRCDLQAAWLWLPVMPGKRFHEPGPNLADLGSEHGFHVRRIGVVGNQGTGGAIGASLLLWNSDPAELDKDIAIAYDMTWFT